MSVILSSVISCLSLATAWSGYLLVLILVIYYIWYRYKNKRIIDLMDKIPGLPGVLLVGNTLETNVDHDELFTRITASNLLYNRKHGVWKAWNNNRPYVFINKAQPAEAVLSSPKLIEKSYEYKFLHPWLGTGLLTSSGSKWFSRRKIITPAFHFQILEDFVEVFREQSYVLVDKLSNVADNKAFNIYPYVTHCALDIICETAMGLQLNAQNCSDSEYIKAVYHMANIVQTRQSKAWLQPDRLFKLSSIYQDHQKNIKILHNFSYKVIHERMKECRLHQLQTADTEPDNKRRLAFLDLLIEASVNGKSLSNEDIREEVDTFVFEGHDTTSAAICWALYLIGTDQKIQRQAQAEVDEVFSNCDGKFTMKNLHSLKYLERCIKESLRLFPSVPIYARTLSHDVKIGDYLVPEGTNAMIVAYQIHRDPEVFPNPEKFDPDRFLPEVSRGRHPYGYLPFSAGPRNCIGQKFALLEEKAVISTVLSRYNISTVTRREDITLLGELILRPKDGLLIKLSPRDRSEKHPAAV